MMTTIRTRRASATVAALIAVMTSACSGTENLAGAAPGTVEIHGYQLQLPPDELAERADLVIVGEAVSDETMRFRDDPRIPESAQDEPGYEHSTFTATTIVVDDVLSGEAPDGQIEVARLQSLDLGDGLTNIVEGAEDIELDLGGRYVLFLSEGDGLWAGKYLALGAQGVGLLEGGSVTFRDGRSMDLTELQSLLEGDEEAAD